MGQVFDHVTGEAHGSFLRGLGDEVSNFSNTLLRILRRSAVLFDFGTEHGALPGLDQMRLDNGAVRPPPHEAEPAAPHLGRNGST